MHEGSEVIPYLNLSSAPLTFFVMQSMQITALTHAKGEENKCQTKYIKLLEDCILLELLI